MERLTASLVEWLRDKAREADAKGLVFGMSGGIDSSVVAVLCKQALPSAALGVLMPCHSMAEDMEHARLVGDKFGISTETVNIDVAYDALVSVLPGDVNSSSRLAQSNIKPRLRMATIYYFANRLGYLVVGSSNRCELGVGYFSKYGDGGVDVMPLGNLVKGQVRELARHLAIPRVIIDKPPSAGLWEGQTDEQEMGLTYDELDTYFTTGKASDDIRHRIEERISRNAHKRTAPPIPPF